MATWQDGWGRCVGYLLAKADPDRSIMWSQILPRKPVGIEEKLYTLAAIKTMRPAARMLRYHSICWASCASYYIHCRGVEETGTHGVMRLGIVSFGSGVVRRASTTTTTTTHSLYTVVTKGPYTPATSRTILAVFGEINWTRSICGDHLNDPCRKVSVDRWKQQTDGFKS